MNTKFCKSFFLHLLFLQLIVSVSAQEQIKPEKKYFVDSTGRLYWNRKLPVYIRIASSPQDTGYVMKSEVTKQYSNPYYFDNEGYHRIRTDWATDQKTLEMVQPPLEVIWEAYADGIAPESKLDFNKPSKISGGKYEFYGDSLIIQIKATDAISGVEKIFYSIDGEGYKTYESPISLNKEGVQKIKYYAVDRVGNEEIPKEKIFSTDLSPPKTYYTITGISESDVIAVNTKITLTAEDSLSGLQSIMYKVDDDKFIVYKQGTYIPIAQLSDGDHKLVFYSVDRVGNTEPETVFSFYLDKTAPIIAADVLGDRYMMDDKIFFSGRTKMKLTAIDNKSGVQDIFYSINGEKFTQYELPFYLPSVQGTHIIKYFATDKMQNNSEAGSSRFDQYKHVVSRIYVDLTGPILSYEIMGDKYRTRDTLFISHKTKIKFNSLDKESGQQYISYSLNSDPDEIRYAGPFQLKEPGFKHIVYFGYDNVNNRNRADFEVFVDNYGPEIKYNFNITPKGVKDEQPVYPRDVVLFLAATDQLVGAKDIFYSLNDGTELKYSLSIGGFKKESINRLKIRATDYLGNDSVLELQFYVE